MLNPASSASCVFSWTSSLAHMQCIGGHCSTGHSYMYVWRVCVVSLVSEWREPRCPHYKGCEGLLCVYTQQYGGYILFMRLMLSFHIFKLQYVIFVKQYFTVLLMEQCKLGHFTKLLCLYKYLNVLNVIHFRPKSSEKLHWKLLTGVMF